MNGLNLIFPIVTSMYILMDIHFPVSPSRVECLKAQLLDRRYS